jgi:ribosomal protein S18 acetylase RimI-like enzyme
MNNNMILRDAAPTDALALSALKLHCFRATFLDEFKIPYPPADLALFEAETYGVETVASELAASDHRTWVIEGNGQLVAYAHVGPCKLPHPLAGPDDGELYQLYLRPDVQGAGLGKRLLDHALAYLATIGTADWLGVWSGNIKAQRFYAASGFAKVGEYKFRVGTWYDEEFIFRRTR